jgi:hypothetical protein
MYKLNLLHSINFESYLSFLPMASPLNPFSNYERTIMAFSGRASFVVGAIGGGITGLTYGMHTGKIGGFDCDKIEADLSYHEICKKLNEEVYPMLKYDIRKLRPITLRLEDPTSIISMPTRRCPPCELQARLRQSRDMVKVESGCKASQPMRVKISSGDTEVFTEFHFDLDTGEISAHDCPKPSVVQRDYDLSSVPQALPDLDSLPDGFIDLGFDWSVKINPDEMTSSTRNSICNLLKSKAPAECVPHELRSLSLQSLLLLKCF